MKNKVKDCVDVNIGYQLKQARIKKGYSMDTLSSLSGIPKSTYFYYENGSSSIPVTQFLKLCSALDLNYDDVIENAKKVLQ